MTGQLMESREPRQDVDCLAGPGARRAAGIAMRVPVLAFVAFGPSCPFPAVGEGQEQNGLPVLAEANWLNGERGCARGCCRGRPSRHVSRQGCRPPCLFATHVW